MTSTLKKIDVFLSIETENETKTNWVTRKRKKNPFPFGYVTRIELKRARSDQPGKEEKKTERNGGPRKHDALSTRWWKNRLALLQQQKQKKIQKELYSCKEVYDESVSSRRMKTNHHPRRCQSTTSRQLSRAALKPTTKSHNSTRTRIGWAALEPPWPV